jgi:hypothetical protein
VAGLIFGLILFVPHLFHPDWVTVRINRQSLSYEDMMAIDYLIPRWLTYLIYLFLIIVPTMISTYLHRKSQRPHSQRDRRECGKMQFD